MKLKKEQKKERKKEQEDHWVLTKKKNYTKNRSKIERGSEKILDKEL